MAMPDLLPQNVPRDKKACIYPAGAIESLGIIQRQENSAMSAEPCGQDGKASEAKIAGLASTHENSPPISDILEAARQQLQRYEERQNAAVAKARQELDSLMSAVNLPDTPCISGSGPRKRRRRYRRRWNKQESLLPAVTQMLETNEKPVQQTLLGQGPHQEEWRMDTMDSLHKVPKQGRIDHAHHAHWIQSPSVTFATWAPESTRVPSNRLGDSNPDGRRAVWENRALRQMIREYLGLNDNEIRYLLNMQLMATQRHGLDRQFQGIRK